MISEPGPALRILLVVASLSGNTRELGRHIQARCAAAGHAVHWHEADDLRTPPSLAADEADLVLLGSWTDNAGRTPAEMKAWVAGVVERGERLREVAVFGTGETQWGQEYYCGAVHRLIRYFNSRYPPLEIEQMPHGARDAVAIDAWTATVLAHYWSTHDADHRRHHA
ncbi:flavodoxin [Stenotrophomonas sp. ESTM1D_MKCIP4_1]|uniref:flavodoxin n=1 Tax=Stenotrophomonas sp. ESTM1D_MKCIP4_1 TaxID=2072414 RepID=UPI0020B118C8|nr:flavodoxin [Stenotrophomonas sp. ESTM1D_MKCIP4_1]